MAPGGRRRERSGDELGQVEPARRPSRRRARRSGSRCRRASSSSSTVVRASWSWRPSSRRASASSPPRRPRRRGQRRLLAGRPPPPPADLLGGRRPRRWPPGPRPPGVDVDQVESRLRSRSSPGRRCRRSMAGIVEPAPAGRPPPARCRAAADAAPRSRARRPTRPTLSDSARPPIGMVTRSSRAGDQPSSSPPASLPKHQRHPPAPVEGDVVGAAPHHCADGGEPVTAAGPPPRPRRHPPATTGTWKSEPAEARTVFGLVGSTVPSQQTTASTPAASAVRIIVPALPGSRTSTQTITMEPPPTSSSGAGRYADHGQDRLGRHRVGDPLDDPGRQVEDPATAGAGALHGPSHGRAVRPLGGHVDRLDGGARRRGPPTAAQPLRRPGRPRCRAGCACGAVGGPAGPAGG